MPRLTPCSAQWRSESYELIGGRWTETGSFAGDSVIRAVPFDAIELELVALWAAVEWATEGEG